MLRDNLVELIEPMLNSAGANPLALTHHQIQASGDRLPCLDNPRPKGAESSLTENVTSPFQAEPAHMYIPLLAPSCRDHASVVSSPRNETLISTNICRRFWPV